jgi:hypothetical protein
MGTRNKLAQYVGGMNDVVTGLRNERPNSRGSLPGRNNIFVRSPKVHTGFVARTPYHSVSTENSFPGNKSGRGVKLTTNPPNPVPS